MITVVPVLLAMSLRACSISDLLSTSRNEVGSSSSSVFAWRLSADAMQPFWNSPSLRVLMSLSARDDIPRLSSDFEMSEAMAGEMRPRQSLSEYRAVAMNSLSVNPLTFGTPVGTMIASLPARALSRVLFPLPLGPQRRMNSPGSVSKLMPETRVLPLCPIFKSFILISSSVSGVLSVCLSGPWCCRPEAEVRVPAI